MNQTRKAFAPLLPTDPRLHGNPPTGLNSAHVLETLSELAAGGFNSAENINPNGANRAPLFHPNYVSGSLNFPPRLKPPEETRLQKLRGSHDEARRMGDLHKKEFFQLQLRRAKKKGEEIDFLLQSLFDQSASQIKMTELDSEVGNFYIGQWKLSLFSKAIEVLDHRTTEKIPLSTRIKQRAAKLEISKKKQAQDLITMLEETKGSGPQKALPQARRELKKIQLYAHTLAAIEEYYLAFWGIAFDNFSVQKEQFFRRFADGVKTTVSGISPTVDEFLIEFANIRKETKEVLAGFLVSEEDLARRVRFVSARKSVRTTLKMRPFGIHSSLL